MGNEPFLASFVFPELDMLTNPSECCDPVALRHVLPSKCRGSFLNLARIDSPELIEPVRIFLRCRFDAGNVKHLRMMERVSGRFYGWFYGWIG